MGYIIILLFGMIIGGIIVSFTRNHNGNSNTRYISELKLTKYRAMLLSLQFEVDGMKAHNEWAINTNSGLYTESAFNSKSDEIGKIVNMIDNEIVLVKRV